jgi:hypothetical protein
MESRGVQLCLKDEAANGSTRRERRYDHRSRGLMPEVHGAPEMLNYNLGHYLTSAIRYGCEDRRR